MSSLDSATNVRRNMNKNNSTNEIRLVGRMSPEVSIKGICLCAKKNCVHNEGIDVVFDVIAHVRWNDLPSIIKQIHELDHLGFSVGEDREWELILRERK